MSKLEDRNSKFASVPLVKRPVRDFTDLEVWNLARDLRRQIYCLLSVLPSDERFAMSQQLRRDSLSVTANIAEGFGRYSYQENIHFCRQARGSAYELRDLLIAASDQKYIPDDIHRRTDLLAQRVIQTLNGYIRATREWQQSGKAVRS